jgi:hypothetical protein
MKKIKSNSQLIKLTTEQKEEIKRLAKIYTNGNVSKWLRISAINYRPKIP